MSVPVQKKYTLHGAIIVLLIFVFLFILFIVYRVVFSNQKEVSRKIGETETLNEAVFPLYTNTQHGYALQYPKEYTVTESESKYTSEGREYTWHMVSFIGNDNDVVSVTTRGLLPEDRAPQGGDLVSTFGAQGKLFREQDRDRVLFFRPNGYVIALDGSGRAFQVLSSTFRFLQ